MLFVEWWVPRRFFVTMAFQLCFRICHMKDQKKNQDGMNKMEYRYLWSILKKLNQEMKIRVLQKLNFYSGNVRTSYSIFILIHPIVLYYIRYK